MFGKECFARMVVKYGKILRNVVRALLCTKVGTQGLRLGITDALGEMKARVWEVTPRVVFLRLSDEDS